MKKLTASIIAGALMISAMGINAFAAEAAQPSIKVYGNAVPSSGETTFSVKLTDFSAVKGMKLEIASDAGLKLTGVNGDIVKDGNYKVTDNKITIVDVTNAATADITVKATVATEAVDSANISVKADLAQNGKSLFAEGTYSLVDGKVAVKTTKANQTVTKSEDLKEETGYFIPYGSLGYTENGVFKAIDKNDDGSFSASNFPTDLSSLSYNKYKLPANKIMTFGQGESEKVKGAYQFGTYALESASDSKTFGTMCIAGDWTEFVEYFKENKNMTESEMLSAIYKAYNETIGNHKYVAMTCNNKVNKIRVYVVKNEKQMWSSNTARQFSLQITGVQSEEYAAVGYALNNGTAVFSDTVQYLNNK